MIFRKAETIFVYLLIVILILLFIPSYWISNNSGENLLDLDIEEFTEEWYKFLLDVIKLLLGYYLVHIILVKFNKEYKMGINHESFQKNWEEKVNNLFMFYSLVTQNNTCFIDNQDEFINKINEIKKNFYEINAAYSSFTTNENKEFCEFADMLKMHNFEKNVRPLLVEFLNDIKNDVICNGNRVPNKYKVIYQELRLLVERKELN